jgi:hypothetical protein
MKSVRILLLFVFIQAALSTYNTTEFWRKNLNSTEPLHFEAFAGNAALIKVINKSIGTDPEALVACITNYSEQWEAA